MSEKQNTKWCAVYTRKSTDENLNSDFTSLDAQRESCEAFIKSRKAEGWKLYPERFDDPAYSGGNTNRPALQRLLAAIREGRIQTVVAYKYDRLSRNIKDFVRILDLFDKQGVAFVSVTQQFDTSTSIGRIFQTMLMGFAQFERELVSERTRDKRMAMIQKGKWGGGMPIIGYDIDSASRKLVVNKNEVKQTRDQFLFYLKEKSLGKTARRLNAQGYRMKQWINKAGLEKGGGRYNKSNLAQVLRNPFYIGKLRHKDNLFPGEHKAIVDETLFKRVQKLLTQNNGTHHSANQDKHDFLLRGLVHCKVCGSFMTPNFAYSKGRKYFYYKCTKVNKYDKDACSVKSTPAKELESLIVQRLAFLGQNKKIVARIVKDAQESSVKAFGPLREDGRRVQDEIRKIDEEAKKLVNALGAHKNGSRNRFITDRLDELQEAKQKSEERLSEIEVSLQRLEGRMIDAEVIQANLRRFDAVFEKLTPNEKKDLLRLLIKEIVYNQDPAKIKMTLRPLPELELEVEDGKVSFDERQKWLPGQDSNLRPSGYGLTPLSWRVGLSLYPRPDPLG